MRSHFYFKFLNQKSSEYETYLKTQLKLAVSAILTPVLDSVADLYHNIFEFHLSDFKPNKLSSLDYDYIIDAIYKENIIISYH